MSNLFRVLQNYVPDGDRKLIKQYGRNKDSQKNKS